MARSDREIKVEDLLSRSKKGITTALSSLTKADADLKILIPAMHKSIIAGDGDFKEANRSDVARVSDPAFAQVQVILQSIARLQAIYSEDYSAYVNNTNDYIATFPESIAEFEKLVG